MARIKKVLKKKESSVSNNTVSKIDIVASKENVLPKNDNIEGKLLNIDENKMQVAIVVQPTDTSKDNLQPPEASVEHTTSKDNLQSSEATTVEHTGTSKDNLQSSEATTVVEQTDTSKDNLQSSEATTVVEQTDISKVVNDNATE